jgi:glycosyltransferase involved in cell wall biosynthesis
MGVAGNIARLLGLRRGARRLVVGADGVQWQYPPQSGHGRVWGNVMTRLGERVDFAVRGLDASLTRPSTPDVWLADGHRGDPSVKGPVVAFVHEVGWGTPELDRDHGPGFAEVMERLTRAAVDRATRVITAAEFAKNQIVRAYGISPDRVYVVPHGVDAAIFRPTRPAPGSVADRLMRSNTPYVVFAASLHPRKNLAAVRQAVAEIAANGYPHVLVMVLAPSPDRKDSTDLERAALAELPGAPGRLIRVMRPSDLELAQLMSGAQAVCQPSLAEGFGLTPLEAMACGAPVIVSNRGALPEVVGDAALIVEPTSDAVKEALLRIWREPDLANRLQSAALRRASEMSWDRAADGWLKVLSLTAQSGDDRRPSPI